MLADSVGAALLVVLDTLAPAERLAFVLHDMFGVPFDEIAPIVGRSSEAARQLASRARRRVQGASVPGGDHGRRREMVAAFLAAAREGNFEGLLALLDPDVVLRVDEAAARTGALAAMLGAAAVAATFSGRAKAARLALLDGAPGLAWSHDGVVQVIFDFTIVNGRIVGLELIAERERLQATDVVFLDGAAA